ncbi:MAG: mechanosensitive ion channel family protein [Phycisphaerae bacterium]
MNELIENISDKIGIAPQTTTNIIYSAAVVVGYILVRALLMQVIGRRVKDIARKYFASKTVTYLLGLVAVIALLRIWLGGVTGLATYLGLLSAGLAVALRDPLVNLVGWLYIVVRKPFTTGDRVQIGTHCGDVVDISLMQFSMVELGNWVAADQSTGRLIHIPTGWVFQHSTCNYTQGFNFIWNELPVTVTFESNWQKAKDILQKIAEQHSAVRSDHAAGQIRRAAQKFMIFYEHLSPIVWTSIADIGVTLTVRYLCQPRQRRSSADRIWEQILREFAAADDIDFAYPTQRFYNHAVEGKPSLRPGGSSGPNVQT